MCFPCCNEQPPIQLNIETENDCKCNCAWSCCLPIFRRRESIQNQENTIEKVAQLALKNHAMPFSVPLPPPLPPPAQTNSEKPKKRISHRKREPMERLPAK